VIVRVLADADCPRHADVAAALRNQLFPLFSIYTDSVVVSALRTDAPDAAQVGHSSSDAD